MTSTSLAQATSDPASSRNQSWLRDLTLLTLALGFFFFLFLGQRPLSNPDEGRYAEIPREMLASSNFVTPRLDGVKYFEKPPLVYWLSAGSFAVFGVNEWSARFWMAAFAVGGGLLTYTAGRWWFGRMTGWWSAIVLCSCLLYYGLSRLALLDLIMSVWMALALFSFLEAVRSPIGRRRRILFLVFYAAMGFAVLTKGLIGFLLPCAVAFSWLLFFNRWKNLRPCHPWSGTIMLLLIALPWHWLMAEANPDFLRFYFIHEHFQRFSSTIHDRTQPWWFFCLVLIGGLFPWIVFAPQALGGVRWARKEFWRFNAEVGYLVLWIGLITVFFSISQSKLIPYILPVFPACAVLIGRYLATVWSGERVRGFRFGAWVAAGLFLALGVGFGLVEIAAHTANGALEVLRLGLSGAMLLGAAVILAAALLGKHRVVLASIAGTTLALLCTANFIAGPLDLRSTKSLALAARAAGVSLEKVFLLGEYFQDFPVYFGRTVDVVEYEGELAFGIHAEPEKTKTRFISASEFRRQWAQPQHKFMAVLRRSELSKWLTEPKVNFEVLAETPTVLLITNGTENTPAYTQVIAKSPQLGPR